MKDRGSPNQSSKRKELKEQEINNIQRDTVFQIWWKISILELYYDNLMKHKQE